MGTIYEYITYYKNISFEESPFNDVDSMIFTQLIYADFKKIIPSNRSTYVLFSDAIQLYLKRSSRNTNKVTRFFKEVNNLLEQLKDAKRYENLKLYYCIKTVDYEKQFCACTIRSSEFTYVVFEGTDSSIIGWKEDFQFMQTFPVASQKFAIDYLNKAVFFTDRNLFVGGHSKGGNLAMTSSMYANFRIRQKIKNVYNFDGPGFRKTEFDSAAFKRMNLKLKTFLPEDSTIGLLLYHSNTFYVVKSSAIGIWQHDPLTWFCFGGIFLPGKLTKRSVSLDTSSVSFLMSMTDLEREKFIHDFFEIFERLGITDTAQIKISKLNDILIFLKEVHNIDSLTKKQIISIIKLLMKGM